MAIRPGKPELDNLRRLLAMAMAEDLGIGDMGLQPVPGPPGGAVQAGKMGCQGDITSTILPEGSTCRGRFVAREGLIFCGGAFLAEIAAAYDPAIDTTVRVLDGTEVESAAVLADWSGPAGPILAAERVALNFLQRLSGIATTTAGYVHAVAGTGAEIYDTRKTTPAWRVLEKYAVRAGGGCNHRIGLYDAVLIKDNHLAAMKDAGPGALSDELVRLRNALPAGGVIEVEVDTLDQLSEALRLDVDVILLDNMSVERMVEAVRMRDESGAAGRIGLEASGGITLANVGDVARTGVERIAVGAITHSAPAVDIALEIETR